MAVTTGSAALGAKTGRRKPHPKAQFRWRPMVEQELPPEETPKPRPPSTRAFPAIRPRRAPSLAPSVAARLLVYGDWSILILGLAAAISLGVGPLADAPLGVAAALATPLLLLKAGLWLVGAYTPGHGRMRAERALGGLALGAMAGLGAAAFMGPDARAGAALAAILPAAALAMTALHTLISFQITRSAQEGRYETAVIVGATEAARRLIQRARESGRMHIAAVVDDRAERAPERIEGVPVAGSVEDLLSWSHLPDIDRIIISVGAHAETRVKGLVEKLRVLPNRVDLIVDLEKFGPVDRRLDAAASVACISGSFTRPGRAFTKRVFDLVVAALLFVLCLPVMLVIAMMVAADSAGPILFRQERHGFNNRIITIFKFRTMKHTMEEREIQQVGANDPRVTRIGRFLRRTSLDELPQLWNVLKGDMSLVGPRPHAVGMRAADMSLTRITADYAHRHRMRPGLTGWAQVNGSRGPLHSQEAVRRRVRLDLQYIAHQSVWLDIWILLRTAPALFGDKRNTR